MSEHKFSVGEFVTLSPGPGSSAATGTYEVMRQLPAEGDENQYRVKNMRENHERVAKESQLHAVRR